MSKVIQFKEERDDDESSHSDGKGKGSPSEVGEAAEGRSPEHSDHKDLLKRVTNARASLKAQGKPLPLSKEKLLARRRKTHHHFAVLDEAAGKKRVAGGKAPLADDDINAYK